MHRLFVMNEKLFTLIELLVVIAIIAVLITLLLPVLGRARFTAKRIACSNNIQQMGIIHFNYETDTGGLFSRKGDPSEPSYKIRAWATSVGRQIEPYVSDPGIFFCPSVPQYEYASNVGVFPLTSYTHWAHLFPHGLRTRVPKSFGSYTDPASGETVGWRNAYFPFVSDIILPSFLNKDTGDAVPLHKQSIAHMRNGKIVGSNALRHDGSCSWQKYHFATPYHAADNAPGSITAASSYYYQAVSPEPFSTQSGWAYDPW